MGIGRAYAAQEARVGCCSRGLATVSVAAAKQSRDVTKLAPTARDVELTIGISFLGMTCSMLGFGYLSDKYGRKPALLVGYMIFCLASIIFYVC